MGYDSTGAALSTAWAEQPLNTRTTTNWYTGSASAPTATGVSPSDAVLFDDTALTAAAALPMAEQVLIIKSWNEWGEGNYLEPDQEFGHGWLEALRSELDRGGHHTTKESP